MWYFSATNNGFYNDQDKQLYIDAGTLPEDLVELTYTDYQTLRDNLSSGKLLKSDESGYPIAYTPEPTVEEAQASVDAAVLSLLSTASMKIAPLQDAVDLGIATGEETASLTAWKNYRVLVNRVSAQSGYPTDIEWPEQPV